MTQVFAGSVADYVQAGWPCIIPVPSEAKFPPPAGFTGAAGQDTSAEQLAEWVVTHPDSSVALRLPDGVLGIDVDHYEKNGTAKVGADTLDQREQEWGPLPLTWCSTARGSEIGPGPARIMFFRAPPGRYATSLGPDIDVIQHHHRYAVVAPSPHSGTGTLYRWYGPDGLPADRVPAPAELPELPDTWARHLAEGAAEAGPVPADAASGQARLDYLLSDTRDPCPDIYEAGRAAFAELGEAIPGSRHDVMARHVYHVVQLGAEGHAGAGKVLPWLEQKWEDLTGTEGRSAEFGAMLLTAARKAAGRDIPQVSTDPCLAGRPLGWDVPAPGSTEPVPDDALEPPQQWSPRQAWGAHLFDTKAQLDSVLARDILMRTWPGLRFAADAGTWLLRGPLRWEARKGEQAKWAVEEMFWLLPHGDSSAPDDGGAGTELLDQAKRRARFGTNAGAGAIAGKMVAQVMSGHHPCALEMADLDQDAEVLWAGGMAWNLRNSGEYPVLAATDSGTPHMHSAACVPKPVATPLWNAFLAAVWPEEADRRWALRVMSAAFTGHPEKLLPILIGPTDRGKTEFIKLLMSVLGTYALKSADARLLSAADRSHASIVYALKGCRLAFIDEAPRTGHLAQERLKSLTGGAPLTGNQMGENPITFTPTHTLVLTANPDSEPVLTDPAVRRRTRLILCEGDTEEIRQARAAIGFLSGPAWRAEAPGVLALMMREAAAWLADPLTADNRAAPESAVRLAERIIGGQDIVGGWVTEETEPYPPGMRARELYKNFVASCRDAGLAANSGAVPSETRWGRRLTELGFPAEDKSDGRYRKLRVRLRDFAGLLPASGGGLTPEMDSSVDSSAKTIHPQKPSSNPPQLSTMDSMDSTHTPITHARTHTRAHTRIRVIDGPPNPPHSPYPPPSQVSDPDQLSNPPPNPPQLSTAPGKPAAKREKAAVPHPDPALEGPVYPLPVIVARRADGEIPWVLPCTPEQARLAAEPYLDHLSVDCETTGYPPGHADFALRTVQLGGEQAAAVLDPADPAQAAVISDLLDRARMLHAHSAAADLVPLAAMRLGDRDMLWAKMTDSVLVVKLADPALAGSDENELKKLAAALLPGYAVSPAAEKAKNALFKSGKWLVKTAPLTPPEKSGWAQVKPGCETMARYAGSDVLDLAAVLRVLPPPDAAVLAREREFQAMCARVAHDGFRLDPAHIAAKIAEHTRVRDECRGHVQALCPGIDNPSSTAQVPAALAELGVPLGVSETTGRASAAKPELERLAADESYEHHELLRAILDYRHHVTTLGLLLEPLGVLCSRGDGRMRPVVYTINADTGRTSCVRPNGQQFSRQGGIRACVIADEGMAGISADFAGVEIRVAAALSGDADLLRAETEGDGLHWMAARMAWGADATKENRYAAKRIIFSKLFGGSATAGARQTGVSRDAAQAVHQAFEAIAPRYAAWDREMRTYVSAGNRGFPAYSGRVIWLPRGRAHAAGNYAIQGSARELLVDGALRWGRTRWGHYPLLPIHDELLTFVPAAEAEEALETLKTCMAGSLNGVPIKAEGTGPFPAWPDSS